MITMTTRMHLMFLLFGLHWGSFDDYFFKYLWAPSPFGSPITCILGLMVLSHMSLILCFFFNLFPLCVLMWIVSMLCFQLNRYFLCTVLFILDVIFSSRSLSLFYIILFSPVMFILSPTFLTYRFYL